MSAPKIIDLDGPLRAKGARAVRPRAAATLILLSGEGRSTRLLMGRRSGGHDFMPHKWVFPGGRVERSDYGAPAASELRAETEGAVLAARVGRSRPTLPRALALAAVRETYEEAGLLLARPWSGRRGIGGWRPFTEAGAAADLEALSFVGRAVTPADRPKRFDAAFFTARSERLLNGMQTRGSGELDELGWFSFEDIAGLDLPTVTRLVAAEIQVRLTHAGRPPLLLLAGARSAVDGRG